MHLSLTTSYNSSECILKPMLSIIQLRMLSWVPIWILGILCLRSRGSQVPCIYSFNAWLPISVLFDPLAYLGLFHQAISRVDVVQVRLKCAVELSPPDHRLATLWVCLVTYNQYVMHTVIVDHYIHF